MHTEAEREMDLQVRGVEFVMAQSQIGLQSLFGLVEVDTLSAPVLHLGSQLIPLLAQFLRSRLSSEQLGKTCNKMEPHDQFYSLAVLHNTHIK